MHSHTDLATENGDRTLSDRSTADRRSALRREMRALRRSLSPQQRDAAAREFARIAKRSRLLRPHRRIALYLPYGGEADTAELIELAHGLRCAVHLPVITNYRGHRMRFARYEPGSPLLNNRYGIPEPQRRRFVPVAQLDLIVVPLVAVDPRGTRLGSGAGFYDRSLQHLRRARVLRRPRLVGLAYEFQRVASIDAHPWDVPVDAVLTERALYPARHCDVIARTR
jgi:5-formyltetrahydrofolate cyclo-ligase